DVERASAPATGITHAVYPVPQALKASLLVRLLKEEIRDALVFTRTKHRADRLARHLAQAGVAVERIHGNRSQAQRTQALGGFKSGKYRVLVATDIAARGIDVTGLGHVVNFDVPATVDDYVHRVGRTGRAEAVGPGFTGCAARSRHGVRHQRDADVALRIEVPDSGPRHRIRGEGLDLRRLFAHDIPSEGLAGFVAVQNLAQKVGVLLAAAIELALK